MVKKLRNKDQSIESGDHSNNNQANRDINITEYNSGLSYNEVKEVAMDIFEKNYLSLGRKVEEIVEQRAEQIVTNYLNMIEEKDPDSLLNTIDPDIRANIYEAQVAYARSGKDDAEKLLVELLVERTINNESDLKNIVINESLSVVSKLTTTQLDLLMLEYIASAVYFKQPSPPEMFLSVIKPFENIINVKENFSTEINFLGYLGCLRLSIGSKDFDTMLGRKNIIGFTSSETIKDTIKEYPLIESFKNYYQSPNFQLKNSSLTPVGQAIAITCLNYKFSTKIGYNF